MFSLRLQWDGRQTLYDKQAHSIEKKLAEGSRKRVVLDHIMLEVENEPDNDMAFMCPDSESPFGLFWLGELYNKDALDLALGLTGSPPMEKTLLSSYLAWGESCCDKFEGEFALIVWERDKNHVFAARDPMGVRQLYYYHGAAGMIFSNEARCIARMLDPRPKISQKGLMLWLLNGYWECLTLFEGVDGLNPAHCLHATRETCSVRRYWDVRNASSLRYGEESEYAEHLLELLETSVADRCRDSKLGLMLSGGLDSGSVAALIAKSQAELTAYTYRFRELEACDEWSLAASVAEKWQMPHRELEAEAHWLFQGWQAQPWQPQPFHSWDRLTELALEDMAADGIATLFTGHGGDNLFTGLALPRLLTMTLPSISPARWRCCMKEFKSRNLSLARGLYRYGIRPKWRDYLARRSKWPNRFDWISREKCRKLFPGGVPWRHRKTEDDPALQAIVWHVDDFTMGVRRAIHWYRTLASRQGVSVKHPLFDRRLAEFVVGIPPEMIRAGGMPKGLLRRVMKPLLPEPIVSRIRKPTLAAYYHQGIVRERNAFNPIIENSILANYGLIGKVRFKEILDKYINGDPNKVIAWFFPVLCVEIWVRKALDEGFSIGDS